MRKQSCPTNLWIYLEKMWQWAELWQLAFHEDKSKAEHIGKSSLWPSSCMGVKLKETIEFHEIMHVHLNLSNIRQHQVYLFLQSSVIIQMLLISLWDQCLVVSPSPNSKGGSYRIWLSHSLTYSINLPMLFRTSELVGNIFLVEHNKLFF